MLFTYPVEAAAENWLHENLASSLHNDMDAVDAGHPIVQWPDCFAAQRRETLGRYRRLRELRDEFLAGYCALNAAERQRVRRAIDDQAALTDMFQGARHADRLEDLPDVCRAPTKALFEKAFEMLTPLGIRDENYRTFLRHLDNRICAFCGAEYFSGASSKREPLDHYLAVSVYPFAGVNSRNLVPMGAKCNSSYKLAQDMLRGPAGARRVCFDPYDTTPVTISLINSRLFARDGGLPDWVIDLGGDQARIQTWDEVFDIRRRFADDHLDSVYKNALKVFSMLKNKQPRILAEDGLPGAFRHLEDLSRAKGWTDRAFLETAVYSLLAARSDEDSAEGDRLRTVFAQAPNALA